MLFLYIKTFGMFLKHSYQKYLRESRKAALCGDAITIYYKWYSWEWNEKKTIAPNDSQNIPNQEHKKNIP